jgi:DNA-binding XRE family transcriptional regulator
MVDEAIAEELEEIAEQLASVTRKTVELQEKLGGGAAPSLEPGRRLARARNKANMTQAKLAEVSGVHMNTIINFEKGHTTPRARTLMALAEVVGIPWESLQEDEDA